jgi:hypothetical protein
VTPAATAHKPVVRRPHGKPVAAPAASPQPSGYLAGGHYVYIFALTRPAKVTALLDAAGARLTGGYGKWEEVAVPRGVPFTQWAGRTLLTMDLALMLDGYAAQRSVEPDILAIEQMATAPGPRPPGAAPITPPPVRFVGAVPHTELTWVISGLDWGECIRDPARGSRLRQTLTLHLMEYVEETTLAGLPPATAPPRPVKVKNGDDLKKLATHYLGKSSRWPEIVKLNKGMRGWQLGKKWVGKTILVPAH